MADTIMSGNIPFSYQSSPVHNAKGDAYRGIGASWFNAGDVADEDWLRSEQSANNALYRDMVAMQYANAFNAEEAQKQRDFEERLANSSYQRAIADMKKSGINPIMLMGNGGADVPQGSSASSSSRASGHSTYRSQAADTTKLVSGLVKAGVDVGLTIATKGGWFAKKVAKLGF